MLKFHPYADLFPLIEGTEFAELVADVKANDLRERIVVWDGLILDGRNRYRAALEAGLIDADDEPDRTKYFVRFVPAVDGDPLKFVLSKNLRRRHLNDSQRASVAAKIATLARGRPASENPPNGGITAAEAATALNIAPRQVERARVVHEQGAPAVREALDRGQIAVSTAEKIARLPEPEQPTALAKALPNGARAIMGSRQEPDDSLDYFPTPPWATRALCEHVLPPFTTCKSSTVWEPACGEGHMAEVLKEYFRHVAATDIHDYGYGRPVCDFLNFERPPCLPDWIITNPPFNDKSEEFLLRALELARVGVAFFLRLQWLESVGRYERIFKPHPPARIAQFAERVPLCKGRWDPEGTTATAYLWIVWLRGRRRATEFVWIPPGQRDALTRPDDAERFTTHPVTRRMPQPEPPPHDPDTGEIIETPTPAASSASSSPPSPDIDLTIPDFLRRRPSSSERPST